MQAGQTLHNVVAEPAAARRPAHERTGLRNTVLSAISNLSTAYNLLVINIVHVLIEDQYCGGHDKCTREVSRAILKENGQLVQKKDEN